jgi:hypothetical protein
MHRQSLILTVTVLIALTLVGSRSTLAADAEPLIKSADELHALLTTELEMTPDQVQVHTKAIRDNAAAVADSEPAVRALLKFIVAYEAKVGTMFIDTPQMNKKQPKDENATHWAAFWAMQTLLDQVYNTSGLAKHSDLIANVKFATADYFPGKVEAPITEQPYIVKIRTDYPETWGGPMFQMDRPARKPTGAYLKPGTVATVIVPESMVNKGYQIRVGAHSWDLERKPRVNRLYRVTTLYDIDRTEMKVANPLGGGIYIEVPYKSEGGIETITIKNAARSPYFSWKSFHKTSLEDWLKVERLHKSPWADFQSDKFMMQVPTSWIYAMDDPVSLMKNWDEAMDIMSDLMGRPRLFGREVLYSQVDTQLRGRAFHPGYPAGNRGYDPTEDYGGYHNQHLVRGPQFAHSYEMHEKGHGFLFPKYAGDREAVVNLPHAAVMNVGWGLTFDQALRSSRSVHNDFATLETTAIAWMLSDNFVGDGVMQGYERQYQLKGHAKFVDIARLFGWEALGRFWKAGHQAYMAGNPWPQNAAGDRRRCVYREPFDRRRRGPSPADSLLGHSDRQRRKGRRDEVEANIKPSAKVYDLLMSYKRAIPEDNAAFRAYALKWWGKQPDPKGYTTQRNHAARWDSYDEAEAKKVAATVQAIIDKYFPEGRPAE